MSLLLGLGLIIGGLVGLVALGIALDFRRQRDQLEARQATTRRRVR